MARPNQVPESSMEEILASIRKIISEDEAKSAPVLRATIAPTVAAPRPINNVSRLFADEPAEKPVDAVQDEPLNDVPLTPVEAIEESTEVGAEDSTLSFPRYRDERSEPLPERTMTIEPADAVEAALSSPDWQPAEPRVPQPPPSLLSPRADAAVASAFSHLAGTILATNSRTIEQMAEDMMRPMLKDWLDDNLPPLVERLVREEIERVSRRR